MRVLSRKHNYDQRLRAPSDTLILSPSLLGTLLNCSGCTGSGA